MAATVVEQQAIIGAQAVGILDSLLTNDLIKSPGVSDMARRVVKEWDKLCAEHPAEAI